MDAQIYFSIYKNERDTHTLASCRVVDICYKESCEYLYGKQLIANYTYITNICVVSESKYGVKMKT